MKKILLTLGISMSLVLTSSLAYDKEEAKKVFSCKGFAQAMDDYGFKFRENAVNFQRQSDYATINLDTTWERVCIDVTDGRIKLFNTKEEQEKLNIAYIYNLSKIYPAQLRTPSFMALAWIESLSRDDVLKNEDKTIARVFDEFGSMQGMTLLFDSENFYSQLNQNKVVVESYNFYKWLQSTKPDVYKEMFKNATAWQKDMSKMRYAIGKMEQNYQEYKGGK